MKHVLFLSGLLIFFFVSCKKNQLGGASTIQGRVVHHEKAISHSRVYIKFNAKEFPGTDVSLYNASVEADHHGNYSFKCYKGDYYLYGVGYDSAISKPVVGGIPVHIRNNETVDADVAVTED